MPILGLFRLVRWPNLLIVAVTQYLLQYFVLVPAMEAAGLSPLLGPFHFSLLVLDTILIAATGYIINDIEDYESDLLNKPDKVYINVVISARAAGFLYFLLGIIGFAIAWYLAIYAGDIRLVFIYPAAMGLLWMYSRYFKKMPLIGNMVVALFCAFVAGVVLFAEREAFAIIAATRPALAQKITLLFGGYLVFAFLSTMLREIVKDMEDMEGDRARYVRSLPIAFGINAARYWGIGFGGLLLVSLLVFSKWLVENSQWAGLVFTWTAILLPLGYTMFLLKNANEKKDFSRLSKLTKFLMLTGLILLLLWKF